MIRYIDMFAGIGGFSLGMHMVDPEAECVFACDNDKDAAHTYRENFDIDSFGDIRQVNAEELPDFDIVLGGFPCQAYSRNGKYYNKNDRTLSQTEDRAELYTYLVNILDKKQPKYFLFENVKGLLNMRTPEGDSCFDIIKSDFENAGYDVYTQLLDTADYGLPQQRKRVFFVGFRKDLNATQFKFPDPEPRNKCVEDILDINVPEKYFLDRLWRRRKCLVLKGPNGEEITRLGALQDAYGSGNWDVPDDNVLTNKVTPLGIIYNDTPSGGCRQMDKLFSCRGISATIATFSTPAFDTKEGWRVLTPRECARLQGFPEDFVLPKSDSKAYKQIGNAVSVDVVEKILTKILNNEY